MGMRRITEVGIAVRDLEAAVANLSRALRRVQPPPPGRRP